tara:strand:+ start:5417 stop:7228 length:1812 start_codon:yes stop_codon:yes gene_type:complete
MTTIEEIKTRLNLIETIESYVPELKQAGQNWKACCPFHSERTPSFVVNPNRGTWHCFGACSTGGDVIEFVRRIEGLELRDAIRICAERAGIELKAPSAKEKAKKEEKDRLVRANESAAIFFQSNLKKIGIPSIAYQYASNRGLDDNAIDRWQIGYAPQSWNALTEHLTSRGFSTEDLIESGLSIKGDKGVYDRFRNRLIFPIRDTERSIIGFGARSLLTEETPKYLNTPQSPLFDKSGSLFGIDQASESIRRLDTAIIVEGYMDVITSHQFGFTNVIASMGTALTEKQLNLIKRFSKNIILALDSDEAGTAATLRGLEIATNTLERDLVATVDWRGLISYQNTLNTDIKVISLPEGEDPDSLIRENPDAFDKLVKDAALVIDHIFDSVSKKVDISDPRSRSNAVKTLAPSISAISDPIINSHYVQKLARLGGVTEQIVMNAVIQSGQYKPRAVATTKEVKRARKQKSLTPDGETQILQLLVQRSECRTEGLNLDPNVFEQPLNRLAFEYWCNDMLPLGENLEESEVMLYEHTKELESVILPDYEANVVVKMLNDIYNNLQLQRKQERIQEALIQDNDVSNQQKESLITNQRELRQQIRENKGL